MCGLIKKTIAFSFSLEKGKEKNNLREKGTLERKASLNKDKKPKRRQRGAYCALGIPPFRSKVKNPLCHTLL